MNFVKMLWRGIRRSKEQPQPELPHRGGGWRKKPTTAGEPQKWQPPTKGTSVADRPRLRRRRARTARAAQRNAR